MSDDSEELVVVATLRSSSTATGSRVFHTDAEDCLSAPDAGSRTEVARDVVESWGYEVCAYCAGEHPTIHNGDAPSGDDRRTSLRYALRDPDHDIHDHEFVETDAEAFADD